MGGVEIPLVNEPGRSAQAALCMPADFDESRGGLAGRRPVWWLPWAWLSPQGPGVPVGNVMRVTVPWSGRELTLMSPSYFVARWFASVSPSPIAPSREV